MAIVAGVNLPDNKRTEIALRRLYGVGPTRAIQVAHMAGILGNPKMAELTSEQLARLREVVDRNYQVEGDLRREVQGNIRRLIDIGCYRGIRHRRSLPLRGQRTRTNARTKRGPRKTVAGRRRTVTRK